MVASTANHQADQEKSDRKEEGMASSKLASVVVVKEPDQPDLAAYGLAKCKRCRRVLTQASLEKNRCRPGFDCGAAEMIRRAVKDGHPDSLEFARNVEKALYALSRPVSDVPASLGYAGTGRSVRGVLLRIPDDVDQGRGPGEVLALSESGEYAWDADLQGLP